MNHPTPRITWRDATTPGERTNLEALATQASSLMRDLRAEDDSDVEDAARFLLTTLSETIVRVTAGTLEVARIASYQAVPLELISRWSDLPVDWLQTHVAQWDHDLRKQSARRQRGDA